MQVAFQESVASFMDGGHIGNAGKHYPSGGMTFNSGEYNHSRLSGYTEGGDINVTGTAKYQFSGSFGTPHAKFKKIWGFGMQAPFVYGNGIMFLEGGDIFVFPLTGSADAKVCSIPSVIYNLGATTGPGSLYCP